MYDIRFVDGFFLKIMKNMKGPFQGLFINFLEASIKVKDGEGGRIGWICVSSCISVCCTVFDVVEVEPIDFFPMRDDIIFKSF